MEACRLFGKVHVVSALPGRELSVPYLRPSWSVQTCQGSRPPLGGLASLGFGGPPVAQRPRDLVSHLPLSPSREERDEVASGPGTQAHVVTGVRAARHEQPRSAAVCSARSRIPGARAPGPRGTHGASVAPPLGQRPGVPGHCPGGPGSGQLLRSER